MPPHTAFPGSKGVLFLLTLLLAPGMGLSGPSEAQATAPAGTSRIHPPLRLVEVETAGAQDLLILHQLGLDVLEREPGNALVAASDADIARLQSVGLRMRVVEPDVESATRRRLGPSSSAYHSFEEVEAELDRLRAARPDLVGRRISLGTSWEGRHLWAVKISDHPEVDEDEPEVLYDALHHAREPMALETLLHAMVHLVRNYDCDPEIRALVDERELWFVPVVNPDGYVWGGIGGMWRKNRRPNPDGSFGVDLNRNYGYQWGYDDLGSSPRPASQTYRGPAPFSEPETAAMRDFISSRHFVTGMTLHAYSAILLLPNGWAEVRPPQAETYESIGHDLEALTGYPHGHPWELLYFSNGRSQDWQVHEAGMVVIEPEIGSPADGFWPEASRIPVLAERNLPAILYMGRVAGSHVAAVAMDVVDGAAGDGDGLADPGETADLVMTLENKGFANAAGVVMRVESTSPLVRVSNQALAIGSLPARTSLRLDRRAVKVSVAANAVPGEPVELIVDLRGGGGLISRTPIELIPGSPTLVFADDAESGIGQWSTTQGWGITRIEGGGHAFADSPEGNYRASTDNAFVLARTFDLSRASRAELRYREIFATEPWDDVCHIEAAIAGQGWKPLAVLPGGVESSFHERRLSLDAYAGEPQVRLRFRLTSNHAVQRDGWTIDDIEVWAYAGVDSSAALAAAASPLRPAGGMALPAAAAGGSVAE